MDTSKSSATTTEDERKHMIKENIGPEDFGIPKQYIDHANNYASWCEDKPAANYNIMSFSFSDAPEHERSFNVTNCVFEQLNKNDNHIFSLNEREDKKGFNVHMHGVAVIPTSFTYFKGPRWLVKLVKIFGQS
jgi:hypothetical protein